MLLFEKQEWVVPESDGLLKNDVCVVRGTFIIVKILLLLLFCFFVLSLLWRVEIDLLFFFFFFFFCTTLTLTLSRTFACRKQNGGKNTLFFS